MVCRLFVPYEYSLFYISARAEEKCQLSFPQFSTIVSTDELGFSLFSFLILECQLFFFLFLSLSQNYEFSDDTPLRKYAFEIAFFFRNFVFFSVTLYPLELDVYISFEQEKNSVLSIIKHRAFRGGKSFQFEI